MIYTAEQAKKYRECDEKPDDTVKHFGENVAWLCEENHGLNERMNVLDLGCGTGRYFCSVPKGDVLIGVDPSRYMLEEAKNPAGKRGALALVEDDIEGYKPFGYFDFVYSVGVLAEHIPLTIEILDRVHGWLCFGAFYFTAEKTKAGKENTISEKVLIEMLRMSRFEKWSISEWNTDTEHFKGTHFEVIAE